MNLKLINSFQKLKKGVAKQLFFFIHKINFYFKCLDNSYIQNLIDKYRWMCYNYYKGIEVVNVHKVIGGVLNENIRYKAI